MSLSTLTPGLLDAEVAYRQERVAVDVATSRRVASWVSRLLGRTRTATTDLTLAA